MRDILSKIDFNTSHENVSGIDNNIYQKSSSDENYEDNSSNWYPSDDSDTENDVYNLEELAKIAYQSNFSHNVDRYFLEFNKLNKSTRAKLGHQISSMLMQCSFAGKVCQGKDFKRSYSAKYGNCYTLQKKKFYSNRKGPDGGLELVLFLETEEYLPGITSGEGAQLVIHEQGTVPFPDEEGIAIASGAQTMIGIKQLCQKICQENKVRATCNCYDMSNLEVNDIIKIPDRLTPCTQESELQCVTELQSNISNDQSTCDCSSPCSEREYVTSVSSRFWPNLDTAEFLLEKIYKTRRYEACADMTDVYQWDFLKLNIYFEDLNYEKISEQPDYEIIQLFSDVGGTIGLWIGLSLLSLFEILHLIVDIIALVATHMWRNT
ncbi:acid-sensing ion channel 1C-like [Physella acuta]|uniref:acid-sensing ion channel 1C-like n=1 Tax=Physella acuta TaxID=109671 RepID=UPI0027DBB86E|nr:acid-sensing ion channel 1C-like [Physella acuta]